MLKSADVMRNSLTHVEQISADIKNDLIAIREVMAGILTKVRGNILILDDDADTTNFIKELLESDRILKYNVVTAYNLEDYQRIARQKPISMAVVDYQIGPGVNSETICRELRAAGVPVIMITGDQREYIDAFCKKHEIILKRKPVNFYQLRSEISDIIHEKLKVA